LSITLIHWSGLTDVLQPSAAQVTLLAESAGLASVSAIRA
jgi:hypothetical protein